MRRVEDEEELQTQLEEGEPEEELEGEGESVAAKSELTVGAPGDRYEREADAVADRVMAMPEPSVQRQGLEGELEEEKEGGEAPLQAKAEATPVVTPRLKGELDSTRGSGAPLSRDVRAFMEPRLGRDLSPVRVHAGARAAGLAKGLRAQAFTRGANVYFAAGKYAPATAAGRRLLAHELAHTVQRKRLPENRIKRYAEHTRTMMIIESNRRKSRRSKSKSCSFSGSRAAAYAVKYAKSPNRAYKKYGKDCTNFVSQAMYAGGWTMIGGSVWDRKDNDVWWYGRSRWSTASYTWGGAENFYRFLKKLSRGGHVPHLKRLNEGDVLQYGPKGGGNIEHTMIVNRKSGTNLYLAYHTPNRLDVPLFSEPGKTGIYNAYKSKKDFYGWNISC